MSISILMLYRYLYTERYIYLINKKNILNVNFNFTWLNRIGYIDVNVVTVIFRSRSRLINDHVCVESFTSYNFTRKIDSANF